MIMFQPLEREENALVDENQVFYGVEENGKGIEAAHFVHELQNN